MNNCVCYCFVIGVCWIVCDFVVLLVDSLFVSHVIMFFFVFVSLLNVHWVWTCLFTKPFALMVRLFANITAGHIIVLSLISMIFIFKSVFVAVPSVIMVLFMDCIELLVAFLQAYIFTLLSALFIGMAMPEHHHD